MLGALILGAPIIWTSVKELRRGILSINELVSIAVLAASLGGLSDRRRGRLFHVARRDHRNPDCRRRAGLDRIADQAHADQSPAPARPDRGRSIAKDLGVGDLIRVRPGDNIAADGVIVSGQGSINQATITGESLPADKKVGDEVFGRHAEPLTRCSRSRYARGQGQPLWQGP